MNKRRKLVIALGAAALAAPLASFAQQQGKVWRVGFLSSTGRPADLESHYIGAFPRGMRELGYVEGKNLVIEWRFADDTPTRAAVLAMELVQMNVDVIVAGNPVSTLAAQKATTTIPIVMANSGDPVGSGFVKSLAHPGGNITGLSTLSGDLGPKHLEMLLTMAPKLTRVAFLKNPANASHFAMQKGVETVSARTKVKILPMEAGTAADIEQAFSAMVREKAGAVIVARDGFFASRARQIAELAAKYRLPTIFGLRENVEAGGLMSYGSSISDHYRRSATYVDKILKGAKPADLPVEQPTKFELIINGKTAKALGLKIPQSLLISAEKVIE